MSTMHLQQPVKNQNTSLKNNRAFIKLPFPMKVHEILSSARQNGEDHIVSWLPHGKSFRVHNEKQFVQLIMPSYFNQSKFTSFTRQLYIYGFQKVQDGPDRGAFENKLFVRDNTSLCLLMKRKPDKPSRKNKIQKNPPLLPAFLNMNPHLRNSQADVCGQGSDTFVEPKAMLCSLPAPMIIPEFPKEEACLEPLSQDTEEDWLAKYERLTSQNPCLQISSSLSDSELGEIEFQSFFHNAESNHENSADEDSALHTDLTRRTRTTQDNNNTISNNKSDVINTIIHSDPNISNRIEKLSLDMKSEDSKLWASNDDDDDGTIFDMLRLANLEILESFKSNRSLTYKFQEVMASQ